MPDPITYEIPSYAPRAIPDGERWVIVYHDGDEEAYVQASQESWLRLGLTSGRWRVLSATGKEGFVEADRVE